MTPTRKFTYDVWIIVLCELVNFAAIGLNLFFTPGWHFALGVYLGGVTMWTGVQLAYRLKIIRYVGE